MYYSRNFEIIYRVSVISRRPSLPSLPTAGQGKGRGKEDEDEQLEEESKRRISNRNDKGAIGKRNRTDYRKKSFRSPRSNSQTRHPVERVG